jgi:predicted NUDIX family NTP pyrophosphohydrolase
VAKISAGLVMYFMDGSNLRVLLAHPGGPLWRNKDEGVWTIPKGEIVPGEDEIETAKREFAEETGIKPVAPFRPLGEIRQKSGKIVHAWAFHGQCDPSSIKSNLFRMEWPPKSGKWCEFPEIDRAEFFTLEEARTKINPAQMPLLERLHHLIHNQHAQA